LARDCWSEAFGDAASAKDPITFLVVPALLVIVALAACLVPATRAARVSPIQALKS
jgi:ABC-type lipoprotein release transport system permease subunit